MKNVEFKNKLVGGLFYTILGLCYGVLRLVFEGDPQLLALTTFATLVCLMAGGYHFGLVVKTHLRDRGAGKRGG